MAISWTEFEMLARWTPDDYPPLEEGKWTVMVEIVVHRQKSRRFPALVVFVRKLPSCERRRLWVPLYVAGETSPFYQTMGGLNGGAEVEVTVPKEGSARPVAMQVLKSPPPDAFLRVTLEDERRAAKLLKERMGTSRLIVLLGHPGSGCWLGAQTLGMKFGLRAGQVKDVAAAVAGVLYRCTTHLIWKMTDSTRKPLLTAVHKAIHSIDPAVAAKSLVRDGCRVLAGVRKRAELAELRRWANGHFWVKEEMLVVLWIHRPTLPVPQQDPESVAPEDADCVVENLDVTKYKADLVYYIAGRGGFPLLGVKPKEERENSPDAT